MEFTICGKTVEVDFDSGSYSINVPDGDAVCGKA